MTDGLYMGPKMLLQNVQMCKRYEFILKNEHNGVKVLSTLTIASEPSSNATLYFPRKAIWHVAAVSEWLRSWT